MAEWNKWHFAPAEDNANTTCQDYLPATDTGQIYKQLWAEEQVFRLNLSMPLPQAFTMFLLWGFLLLGAFWICQEWILKITPLELSRNGMWKPCSLVLTPAFSNQKAMRTIKHTKFMSLKRISPFSKPFKLLFQLHRHSSLLQTYQPIALSGLTET